MLAVVGPQYLRPGRRIFGADQIQPRHPVGVIPLLGDQLEGPNDNGDRIQGFASRAIGHVHNMPQVAVDGFLSRVGQFLAQCLFDNL